MSSTTSAPPTQCKICDRKFKSTRGLAKHIVATHKIKTSTYYDSYLSYKPNACITCGIPTKFLDITEGYNKYCSQRCSRNDPELRKRKAISISKTFKNDPSIMERSHIKRRATLAKDPTIMERSTVKLLQTLKENPHIRVNATKKMLKTLQANPEIRTIAVEKQRETYRQNPHIQEQSVRKFKRTLASDPSIMIASEAKRQQTLKVNPDILVVANKKIRHTFSLPEFKDKFSMRLREYYAKLRQHPDTTRCSIYLIAHSSKSIVKIGITTNLKRRMKEIREDFGSANIIRTVNTVYGKASTLEIKMHKRYNKYCQVQSRGKGKTEWFSKSIEASALKMLEEFESSIYPE